MSIHILQKSVLLRYIYALHLLIIQTISAIKFTNGGAAILLIIVINHKKEIKGDKPKIPFLSKILRENERK